MIKRKSRIVMLAVLAAVLCGCFGAVFSPPRQSARAAGELPPKQINVVDWASPVKTMAIGDPIIDDDKLCLNPALTAAIGWWEYVVPKGTYTFRFEIDTILGANEYVKIGLGTGTSVWIKPGYEGEFSATVSVSENTGGIIPLLRVSFLTSKPIKFLQYGVYRDAEIYNTVFNYLAANGTEKSFNNQVYENEPLKIFPQLPEVRGKRFIGWDIETENVIVTSNMTFTAQYDDIPQRSILFHYLGEDGAGLDYRYSLYECETVTDIPTPPQIDGKTFTGWDVNPVGAVVGRKTTEEAVQVYRNF